MFFSKDIFKTFGKEEKVELNRFSQRPSYKNNIFTNRSILNQSMRNPNENY